LSDTTEVKTCQKRPKVLMDVHLELEPPSHVTRGWRGIQDRASDLRAWAKELEEFIRDHRSRDAVNINVVEERKDLCSACNREWETYEEEGKTYCACCGALVTE